MKFEYEPKTDPTMYALHAVAQHWVETEIIIEDAATKEVEEHGPDWTPDSSDQDSMGEFYALRDAARYMHDEIMVPMHRYSCIVMLYSSIERELLRLVEHLEEEKGRQKLKYKDIRGSRLEQFSKFCEVFFQLRLTDCPQYDALTDLQKIRDCIVHCLGDVDLVNEKDRKYLLTLDAKRPGFFGKANEIHIGKQCIQQFLLETWSFFMWVFQKLNWKITSSYQADKLGPLFKKLPQTSRT